MNERSDPARVLITGAAGFVGSHVVDRLLDDGLAVWGVDNFDPFYPREIKESNLRDARTQPGFRFAEGDLRDSTFLERLFEEAAFDAAVHLAARPGVRASIERPEEYFDCNVLGTLRLLEAIRSFGVPALVFTSSSSVYGARDADGPFAESDPTDRPLSPYAATKAAAESLCHTYTQVHGIRCCTLRLFTVYGPRQRPDLAIHKFARAMLDGRPVPVYGDGSAERDYTYVSDTVDAVSRALDHVLDAGTGSAASYDVLNIGSGRPVSVGALVERLGAALEREPEVEHLPEQPGDVPRTWADISRAGAVLGFEPRVELDEGLRRFIDWLGSGATR